MKRKNVTDVKYSVLFCFLQVFFSLKQRCDMSTLKKGFIRFICVILLFVAVVHGKVYAAESQCDRDCLIDYMTSYLDALVAHDPTQLPLSESLKYTVDGVVSELGGGLWDTAVGIDAETRLDFADPEMGQVGSQLLIEVVKNENRETTKKVLYQVRLKVVDDEISEIETMVLNVFSPKGMIPEPVFMETPQTPMTREELKEVMDLYVDYLEGTVKGKDMPFDENCARYENGIVTANGLQAFKMQSFWRFKVTRRYLVFDVEQGIVWAMLPFSQHDSTLVVGEAFKIMDGKIMMIQAVMKVMPAKAWD